MPTCDQTCCPDLDTPPPPELPVTIVKPLRDRTALERHRVILECTVSSPRATVHWFRGANKIVPSERFTIHSEGCYHKLVIQPLVHEDEGTYNVQVEGHTSSAQLLVEGEGPGDKCQIQENTTKGQVTHGRRHGQITHGCEAGGK